MPSMDSEAAVFHELPPSSLHSLSKALYAKHHPFFER